MRPSLLPLALLALLPPSTAYAQNAEVERLLREGIELRQRGSNDAALASPERAHQLARTPRTLAQVALAEPALGRWVDAETHLREALRSAADPWYTTPICARLCTRNSDCTTGRCSLDPGVDIWRCASPAGRVCSPL